MRSGGAPLHPFTALPNYPFTKLLNYQIPMKIEGTQKIDASRERIFAALVDPAVLQKCIPGCEQMEKTGENQYNAKLTAGVGPVKGVFTATVSLQEIVPPEHYRIVVEGKGQPGFVKGSGELNLKDADGATEIQYTGEVN